MPFKINISEPKTGRTYKIEQENESLLGKELEDKVNGSEIIPELAGYELQITGTSDKAGLTSLKSVAGIGLKRVLLTYGKGLRKRPRKEGKKKRSNMKPYGLRMRRTVRGSVISPDIIQINMKVLKKGEKELSEVFPEQAAKQPKKNRAERRKGKAKKETEQVKASE